jgi:sucrose phosphorylase
VLALEALNRYEDYMLNRLEQVQLIAYADRFGGSLRGLARLLDGPLAGVFGGVHVLPFYLPHDGADAGFDPDDHLTVDPRLGTWDDVAALARDRDVVADLIVNHISDRSRPFRDVGERGNAAPSAGMFLTYDRVFPLGATEADLLQIVRPRPGLPFTPAVLGDRPRLLWTTFTPHQIDLDVHDPAARGHLSRVLRRLAESGVTTVRLDAVGYAVKTAGTSCFLTPETFAFIDDIAAEAHGLGLEVLAEVHAPHRQAVDTAAHVDRIYDFALGPLVLHAIFTGDGRPLRNWLSARPANTVTVLDTHDGLGMVDAGPGGDGAGGLLSTAQLEAVVDRISVNSGGTSVASRVRSGVYQVSCTAYDALGRVDRDYLLARLLQLFVPGVPQIYYVGLLAGRNVALASPRRDAREINRRRYDLDDVFRDLGRPVVRALLQLIRIRNSHRAFAGRFEVTDGGAGELELNWHHGEARAGVRVRLPSPTATGVSWQLSYSTGGGTTVLTDTDLLAAS